MKQTLLTLIKKIHRVLQFLLNPRFLLCFGMGWIITNGWAYVLLGLGTFCDIGWMKAVAGAYLAFLWFPFTPEKIITVGIAIGLLRLLFPNDTATLAVLHDMRMKAKESVHHYCTDKKQNRRANRRSFESSHPTSENTQ